MDSMIAIEKSVARSEHAMIMAINKALTPMER